MGRYICELCHYWIIFNEITPIEAKKIHESTWYKIKIIQIVKVIIMKLIIIKIIHLKI